jgi:Fe-S cluster assembly iron-binding protein IscA
MLQITEKAREELQKRFQSRPSKHLVRLQMRHSCFMKGKLTMEEVPQADDIQFCLDDIIFILNNSQVHYFRNKKLD